MPINVTSQRDWDLWLDLSFGGWVLQDHGASLDP